MERGASSLTLGRLSRLGLPMQASLSGILIALTLLGFGARVLAWVCLVPLAVALASDTLRATKAAALGFTAGLVADLPLSWFLVSTLERFAAFPATLAILSWLLFAAFHAGLYAAAAALSSAAKARLGLPRTSTFPIALVLAELVYPMVFPLHLGTALHQSILLIQIVDITGPLGASFLMAVGNMMIAEGIIRVKERRLLPPPWRALAASVGAFALVIAYGAYRVRQIDSVVAAAEQTLRVGIVQTNEGIFANRRAARAGVEKHRLRSQNPAQQGAELIVWPETAYDFPLTAAIKDVKASVVGSLERPVLFGGLRIDAQTNKRRLYHSAFLADATGHVLDFYDKRKLVPLGEYIPFGDIWPRLYDLSPHSAHFSQGENSKVLNLGGIRLAVHICYEDLFPSLIQSFKANSPQLLVNLTNDSWFGDSNVQQMHLDAASFRAVEQRRFLIRATNTGISAVVDPAGRVVASIPSFTAGDLVHEVALLTDETWYARFGELPFVAGLVLYCLFAWGMRARRGRNHRRLATALQ